MSKLSMTFACGLYDRMVALKTGEVQPEGIDLNFINIDNPRELFDRMVGKLEFDASEMSSSEYVTRFSSGDCPFVALPVFPSRMFRHIFINRRSGIRTPKNLEGSCVGLPIYTQTAAIWARGHLMHQFGVDLDSIRWVQGAVEGAGTHGKPHAPSLLRHIPIEQNTSGTSLADLLAKGEIDALIGSRTPDTLGRDGDVVRLFPDYRALERTLEALVA